MAAPFIEGISPYTSEQRLQDNAVKTVIGIGVLVVLNEFKALNLEELGELDPNKINVLTARELKAKAETDRQVGDITLFQETIKVVEPRLLTPESNHETLLGAMEEIVDRKGYHEVGGDFQKVVFGERPQIALESLPGRAGGIEVVIFNGPKEYPFSPAVQGEVAPAQWMNVQDYNDNQSARPASRELLSHAIKNRLLQFGLQENQRGATEPVFPQSFQFDRFYRKRKRLPDISKFVK